VYGKDLKDTDFRTDVFEDGKQEQVNRIKKFGKQPPPERENKTAQLQRVCIKMLPLWWGFSPQ